MATALFSAPDENERLHSDLLCPKCDYSLRGLTGTQCPECGCALDWAELARPQIPWVHRKSSGRFRAYWRTVWFVAFRSRWLANEMVRPVSYPHAQRFRWVTILHVYLPWLIGTLVLFAVGGAREIARTTDGGVLGPAGDMAVWHACTLLFLASVTGVPSYFFHPKRLDLERQNRAVALSYYTCAPLACLLFAYVLIPISILLGETLDLNVAGVVLLVVGTVVALASLLAWPICLRRLGNRVLGPAAAWKVLWLPPLLWLLLVGLILVALPALLAYVALIVVSLL